MINIIAVSGPVYSGKTSFIQNHVLKEHPEAIVLDFATVSQKYRLKKLPYHDIFEDFNKSRFLLNRFVSHLEHILFQMDGERSIIIEVPIFTETQPLIQKLAELTKKVRIKLKWMQLTVDEAKQSEIKTRSENEPRHRSSYFGAEDYLYAIIEVISSNAGNITRQNSNKFFYDDPGQVRMVEGE